MRILAILTCYNRKFNTENCIRTIVKHNPECDFTFVVADDGSTDGTAEALQNCKQICDIHILKGKGTWFYSGGMHVAMRYALEQLPRHYDYLLMMNDDVTFLQQSIQQMITQSKESADAVIVGAMKNDCGDLSYGAIKYTRGYHYKKVCLSEYDIPADTFNANCVLIPYPIFCRIGAIDSHYIHSLGDFDYGLSIKRAGYSIYQSKEYVGICNNNDIKGSWADNSLSLSERIRKKESIKGDPTKQWFYFLNKNFGVFYALMGTISPFLRIVIKK